MPGDPTSGFVEVGEGIRLRYAHWRLSPITRKGTVIILQGRSEYIEKQYELTADLLEEGYDVLNFDWRGQGGSSRLLADKRAGYVDEFEEYVDDLMAILQEVALPDCVGPFHILGHSTGSLVALMAAPKIGNRITRMVLCSPFLGIGHQPISHSTAQFLAGTLAAVGLGRVYLTGRSGFPKEWDAQTNVLTSSEEHFERNIRFAEEFPELTIDGATASWVYAACKGMEVVKDPDFHNQITIPILILTAGLDKVVANRETELLAKQLRSGSLLTIEGARHELWQEIPLYREQFFAAFKAFVPGSSPEHI